LNNWKENVYKYHYLTFMLNLKFTSFTTHKLFFTSHLLTLDPRVDVYYIGYNLLRGGGGGGVRTEVLHCRTLIVNTTTPYIVRCPATRHQFYSTTGYLFTLCILITSLSNVKYASITLLYWSSPTDYTLKKSTGLMFPTNMILSAKKNTLMPKFYNS
jgi:hypothetical protein